MTDRFERPPIDASQPPAEPQRSARPATVRWGLGIFWVGVVLTLVVTLIALLGVGAVAGAAIGPVALVVLAAVGVASILQIGLLLAAGSGYGWARWVLAVLVVIGVAPALTGDAVAGVGAAVSVLAVVLLFLPASNAWFAAETAQRRALR